MSYYQWGSYIPVAERRRQAARSMRALRATGIEIQPIEIEGRKIATTFWGKAWCDHIESLGKFANRLPRGRTYVRNGSVCHLAIERGQVTARVSGTSIYTVQVKISALPSAKWKTVMRQCSGQIGSLLELLQGRLSDHVMQAVTASKTGLFPSPKEIRLDCSCPDWAVVCKHVAAVLYGVGARLDEQPELLFLLRGVNHEELIATRADEAVANVTRSTSRRRTVAEENLAEVFGIDLHGGGLPGKSSTATTRRRKPRRKKTAISKAAEGRRSTVRSKKVTTKTTKKRVIKKKAATKVAPKKAVRKKATPKKPTRKKVLRRKVAKKTTKGRAARPR